MLEKVLKGRPCFCGSGRSYRDCHEAVEKRIRDAGRRGAIVPGRKLLRTRAQLEGIRASAGINMRVLDAVAAEIQAGMPLSRIDEIVYETTCAAGAVPAPLHYEGYPYSVCVSVNDQVCHGFPRRETCLKTGDIVNVDCSTEYEGFFSDASRMFEIGTVDAEAHRLVENARDCIAAALSVILPWQPMGVMSAAVQDCAHRAGFSVVTMYGGHGCGVEFHEDPFIDYGWKRTEGMLMVPGMTFTIEPMINQGTSALRENGWEVYTRDGKLSAQWEVQVLVTGTGAEVLCR